jgi:hypothetical protein
MRTSSAFADDVPSCGRGIASDVQLGVDEAFGKAAEDADQ